MQNQSDSGNKWFVLGVSLVAALGGFLFGFDTAVISGTIGFVKDQFAMDAVLEGWFVSSALVGCVLGVSVAGLMSDRFGRKRVLLLSGALFFASAMGCMLAPDMISLIVYRVLGGVGVGMASMLSPLYISEISPAAIRGRMVALYQFAITIGILLAYFSNALIANGNFLWSTDDAWRTMFGAEMIPAFLFVVMLFFIPESPRWLVVRGYKERAMSILSKVDGSEKARKEIDEIEAVANAPSAGFREIFAPGMRIALFVGIAVAVSSQLSGINAVIYYGVQILNDAGLSQGDALGGQVIIGVVNVLFTILAIWKIDQLGRRPLLLWGVSGIVIAHLMIGYLFYTDQVEGYALMFFLLFFIACFAFSFGPISWILISEIYPTRIRARVVSLVTLLLWGANAVLIQIVPWLLENLGSAGTFWLFAGLSAPVLWIAWKILPETKGKSLEEIEAYWHGLGKRK